MSAERRDAAGTARPAQPTEVAEQIATLVAICNGQAAHLPALDLLEIASSRWTGVSKEQKPVELLMAIVALNWFCDHAGVRNSIEGDRAVGLAGDLRRYLVPYLLELGLAGGPLLAHDFWMPHGKEIQIMLSGATPLPAATVAGDLLGRRYGVTCVWLTLEEAVQVSTVSRRQLIAAAAGGALLRASRTTEGVWLIPALDLREAGWLREPALTHGVGAGSASNILATQRAIVAHARAFGVSISGDFSAAALPALTPLAAHAQRAAPDPVKPYLSLEVCWQLAGLLHPTNQLVLWLQRLVGLRISEAYGPLVGDFRDGPTPTLRILRQGGSCKMVRDPVTKKFVAAPTKKRTKTPLSRRWLPLPAPVAALIRAIIAAYHTDLETGQVNRSARLVPGLQQENVAGAAGYRNAVKRGLAALGIVVPGLADDDSYEDDEPAAAERLLDADPHDLRGALITDLHHVRVNPRLGRFYCGHTDSAVPNDEHTGYDTGVQDPEVLREVAEAIEGMCTAAGGPGPDLRVATDQIEGWGKTTRRGRHKQQILAQLNDAGWRVGRAGGAASLDFGCADDMVIDAAMSSNAPILLTAAQIAVRHGEREASVRRKMADGTIPSRQLLRGDRQLVRLATLVDVDAAMTDAGSSIDEVAADVGWTSHQVWALLRRAGELEGHSHGRRIVLSDRQVQLVNVEVTGRLARATVSVTVKEAAVRLGLELLTVETLLRRGTLTLSSFSDGNRRRYVCLASIETFLSAYPPGPAISSDAELLPRAHVKALLGEDRIGMAHLITSRQLIACTRDRKQCLTRDSVLALARARGLSSEILVGLAR